MDWLSFFPTVIGIITVIVGAVLVAKSQALKTALDNYKELSASYEKKTEDLEDKVQELETKTETLQLELKVFKETPLNEMSKGINALLRNQLNYTETTEKMSGKVDIIDANVKDIKEKVS